MAKSSLAKSLFAKLVAGEQAIHNSQWSSCCAWRLAAFPPLSSAWSLRIVRKLTRGAPCFTGLIGGYCSHWLRRLFRPHWAYSALLRSSIRNSRLATLPLASLPPLSSAWSLRIVRKLTRGSPCFTGLIGGYCSHRLRRLFRPHWTSASPVSRTARGEAPSHRARASCAPLALSLGVFLTV